MGALLASPVLAETPPACDLAAVKSGSQLHDLLSRRAVKVIELAGSANWRTDKGLATRVAPNARFMLGQGDVGSDFDPGVDGARAMAVTMQAERFQYPGWDYMDMDVDACAEQKVVVDFIGNQGKTRSSVTFTFMGGQVTAAEGWRRSLTTGAMKPVAGAR